MTNYEITNLQTIFNLEPEFRKYAKSLIPFHENSEVLITKRAIRYANNALRIMKQLDRMHIPAYFDLAKIIEIHNDISKGLVSESLLEVPTNEMMENLKFCTVDQCVDTLAKTCQYTLFAHYQFSTCLLLVNDWLYKYKRLAIGIDTKDVDRFLDISNETKRFSNHYKMREFLLKHLKKLEE